MCILLFVSTGADLQPVHVRNSERHSCALLALRAQDVPGALAPREVCAQLSRQQEGTKEPETGKFVHVVN
jgi:hypothetical protein